MLGYNYPVPQTDYNPGTGISKFSPSAAQASPRGGYSHMKGAWMLVVSLRGVNFGFWSHLGCSGQNGIIFRRKRSRLGLHAKKFKKYMCVGILKWSLLGAKKKSLSHAHIGLL